jgi:hypothetical protein
MDTNQFPGVRGRGFTEFKGKTIMAVLILLVVCTVMWAKDSVRYAGFCFTGNFADLPVLYRYTYQPADPSREGQDSIERFYYDFFRQNSAFANFTLDTSGQGNELTAFALAVNREDLAFETFGGKTKAIYNLGCSIYLLDFKEMTVLQTYPLRASFIEIYNSRPDEAVIGSVFRELLTKQIPAQIKENASRIGIRKSNTLSMRVAEVKIADEALPCLGMYQNNLAVYADMMARHLTSSMAFNMGVTMLPYARDAGNQKMSLAFSDARMQDFTIPPASYDLSMQILKFVKKPYKETAIERVDLYGAYVNVKIHDAELGTVYWQEEIKHGAAKQIVVGQSVEDEFFNYHEVLLANIFTQVPQTMREDKNLMKGVIKKCASY